MKLRNSILALLIAAAGFTGAAQSAVVERPVLSAFSVRAGTAHVTETYLSPLHYAGTALGLHYERTQAMRFNPERWVMRLHGRLDGQSMRNRPARNASMLGLDMRMGWGMMYRRQLDNGLTLMAGGATDVSAGVLYSRRNSNNPAAAKASWTVNAAAAAAWNTRLGRLPVCLRYIAEMPLTGIFFSPQYGELYYEIYLGNHRGLVHAAWPGNFFRLDNLLTADLRFGGTILRLGYSCDVFSGKASNIVTRRVTHTATIGIATEWLSLGRHGVSRLGEAKIISSLY